MNFIVVVGGKKMIEVAFCSVYINYLLALISTPVCCISAPIGGFSFVNVNLIFLIVGKLSKRRFAILPAACSNN